MRIKRRALGQIASFTTLALISAVFLAPVIWIALTALKTQREALALPPVWSFTPQWHNFIEAWQSNDFAKSLPRHDIGIGLFGGADTDAFDSLRIRPGALSPRLALGLRSRHHGGAHAAGKSCSCCRFM